MLIISAHIVPRGTYIFVYQHYNDYLCLSKQTQGNMFKPNIQSELFSFETELSKKQRELLENSKEKWFYNLILSNIDENNFKFLFSDKASRPNVAVNILVSALILKELRGISYDELMESMMFDLRFKAALGLTTLDKVPFSRGTIFNFQNRVLEYEQQTGINLIEQLFDALSSDQVKMLKLKTDIQRTDSTLVSSNIKRYSRVQLIIEVLLRLERILEEKDKQNIGALLQPYLKTGSNKYVYGLKSVDLPRELESLGKVYQTIHCQLNKSTMYQGTIEFDNFDRVYKEHFVEADQQISPKPVTELNSGMLQSPDDRQATYRKKKEQRSKGFTINATETASPHNPIQLITDIAVNPNNIDDTKILNSRIDNIKEKTPELNELHTDGGYGSEENDKKLEELNITQITTAVRGAECGVEKTIALISESPVIFSVACPNQTIESTQTNKRHKVRFDLAICIQCMLKENCQSFKNKGIYYFKHEDYRLNKRSHNILAIPKERRKLRPNVEATMNEYKVKTRNGKLKVRGLFKTSLFAFTVGIAINFGRIFRYLVRISPNNGFSSKNMHPAIEKLLNFVCLALNLAIFESDWLNSKNNAFIQFSTTLNFKGF